MADETVGLIPVGGGLSEAVWPHQVDDVGAGALADFGEPGVCRRAGRIVFEVLERAPQGG
ncbi:hypothetical protein D3C78_1284120 [compost metagenome]